LKVNVVARDEISAEKFMSRHKSIAGNINVISGARSLFAVISDLVSDGDDVEIFCHDDVFLPSDFLESVSTWVVEAERSWPSWGIAGNAGVPVFPMGLGAHEVIRFLADPHGGPTGCQETVPCQSIDGNLVVLNCKALRSKGFSLPNFSGFHLYDLVASLETLRCGLAVLASPALFCYHDSKGSQIGFEKAWRSSGFQEYLRDQLLNSEVMTVNGPVKIDRRGVYNDSMEAFDLPVTALLNAGKGRPQPTLEIVTRTTFQRLGLLERNCLSVDIANEVARVVVNHTIVTGYRAAPEEFCGRKVVVFETEQLDDRYELVLQTARRSRADFLWFVDDDDWVFPNRFEMVLSALAVSTEDALVCGGAAQFDENLIGHGDELEFGESSPIRMFESTDLLKSFSGHNYLPFSACLFPTKVLRDLPEDLVSRVTYYEDFATTLFVASSTRCWTRLLPWALTGISVRSDGTQSVSSDSRDEWNRSMAEFRPLFLEARSIGQIADVVSASTFRSPKERLLRDDFVINHLVSQRDEAIEKLEELAGHWTWRVTRPFRIFRGVRRLLRQKAGF